MHETLGIRGEVFRIGKSVHHPPDSQSTQEIVEKSQKSSYKRMSALFQSFEVISDEDLDDVEESYTPPMSPHRQPIKEKINWKKGMVIGTGAFGTVYMGLNTDTGEMIAVKQIPLRGKGEDQYKEINNEISLMRKLRHPHIVALYSIEEIKGHLNIIMEYVPGRSLDYFYETFGPLDETTIQLYTFQMLQALKFIHSKGVVHRDIKAKNILVDARGNIKLGDFGSAKFLGNSSHEMKTSAGLNYTALWCAPEVFQGRYNFKCDIWSLGCVLIEISTAKAPWHEMQFPNHFAALFHIGQEGSRPEIPKHLSKIGQDFVDRCLTRNPEKRWEAPKLLKHRFVAIGTKR